MSLPHGSIQASLLGKTGTPVSPESQTGRGNASDGHPLGICQSQELEPRPLGTSVLCANREVQA